MAIRDLTTETMVKCLKAWIDLKRERKFLLSLPTIEPLIPIFDDVYKGLLEKQSGNGVVAKKIKDISGKQSDLDTKEHDPKLRGTYNLLTGMAEIVADPKVGQACLDLRDALCPDGIAGVLKSYTDEAGAAEMLSARLTADQNKLLNTIKLPGGTGTLMAVVKGWCAAASELGVLEEKKVALQRRYAVDDAALDVKQAEVYSARHAWMNAFRALETNLDVAKVDPAVIDRILGPVRDAEAKVARGSSTPTSKTTTPVTTTPVTTTPVTSTPAPIATPPSPPAATTTNGAPPPSTTPINESG